VAEPRAYITVFGHRPAYPRIEQGEGAQIQVVEPGRGVRLNLTARQRSDLIELLISGSGMVDAQVIEWRGKSTPGVPRGE
jgi:hypothetical protein